MFGHNPLVGFSGGCGSPRFPQSSVGAPPVSSLMQKESVFDVGRLRVKVNKGWTRPFVYPYAQNFAAMNPNDVALLAAARQNANRATYGSANIVGYR